MSIFDWVSSIVPINQFSSIAGDLQGEAFAHLGATAYVAASKVIAADNLDRPLQKLDENRKNWLRPDFASLVDTVRIVYGADLIPSINVLGFDLKTSTIAQTFGDRIYVRKKYAPDTDTVNDEMVNQLIQLAHELIHVRQYHNRGKSLYKFGKAYFRGYYDAGFSYAKNSMEVDAFAFNRCFQERLFSHIAGHEIWRSTLVKGLTSIVPFRLNNQQHFLAYKSSDGTANIGRIRSDGHGVDIIWSATGNQKWTKGWTAFVPFLLGGKPHYLAYKSGSGQVAIDRIRANGQGVDAIWPTQGVAKFTKGWTAFVPFVLNGQPHYLAYKVGTGAVHIDRIRADGQGVDNVWKGQWSKGWTSIIGFELQGKPHVLTYKNESGYVHIDSINDQGMGTTRIWCDEWTKGWTAFFPFMLNGQPFHLAYKKKEGTVAIDSIDVV